MNDQLINERVLDCLMWLSKSSCNAKLIAKLRAAEKLMDLLEGSTNRVDFFEHCLNCLKSFAPKIYYPGGHNKVNEPLFDFLNHEDEKIVQVVLECLNS